MALLKSDLNSAPSSSSSSSSVNNNNNLQNVVVYVSNDNFAQSYAVESSSSSSSSTHSSSTIAQNASQHQEYPSSMASMEQQQEQQTKNLFTDKSPHQIITSNNNPSQSAYFESLLNQNNGYHHHHHNALSYQNGSVGGVKNSSDCLTSSTTTTTQQCDRQQQLINNSNNNNNNNNKRENCDNINRGESSSFVTIISSEVPISSQSSVVRCDSVRSDAAESSCSSLSSAEDGGMVVLQNSSSPAEMLVYDSSIAVRPDGGVVLVAPPQHHHHHHHHHHLNQLSQFTTVPFGWKRLVNNNNGSVIYISPSNTALNSLDQVKEYLLTTGTCKCGLECHFKYDSVFNFDSKVISKPWIMAPDTNIGDLTKLCNHKRKIMAMSSLDCKPSDLEGKMRKDYGLKKKKRKIGVSMAGGGGGGGGISVSQILAQREKFALEQQMFNKEIVTSQQQVWSNNSPTSHNNHISACVGGNNQQQNGGGLIQCHDDESTSSNGRMMTISPMIIGGGENGGPSSQQPSSANNNLHNSNISVHSHHVFGPNGQMINLQENQIIQGQNNINTLQLHHHHHQQQQQQQPPPPPLPPQHHHQHNRIYMNHQPEQSGPGRPNNIDMHQHNHHHHHQQQHKKIMQQQQMIQHYEHVQQHDGNKNIRPFGFNNNGVRPPPPPSQGQFVPNIMQIQQQRMQWQQRMQHQQMQNIQMQQQNNQNNVYERVPPLHQHAPNTIWQEEIRRKKVKLGKFVKGRQYQMIDNNCNQMRSNNNPCPNVDVRQIANNNNNNDPNNSRAVMMNQIPSGSHSQINNAASSSSSSNSSPSFMEDPSGYLAQQTALLNNTINRQTGVNNNNNNNNNNASMNYCGNSNDTTTTTTQNVLAISQSQSGEIPLPSNLNMSNNNRSTRVNTTSLRNPTMMKAVQYHHHHHHQNNIIADSSAENYIQQCQGCVTTDYSSSSAQQKIKHSDSGPSTPSSCSTIADDPVTSSVYSERQNTNNSQPSPPDNRPIQGGTVSTSNVSPLMDSIHSDPPTPNSHTSLTPTPTQNNNNNKPIEMLQQSSNTTGFSIQNHDGQIVQIVSQSRENYLQDQLLSNFDQQQEQYHFKNHLKYESNHQHVYNNSTQHSSQIISNNNKSDRYFTTGVTTMASGRTSGCNTITSVVAGGRSNNSSTATVSINNNSNNNNNNNQSSQNSVVFSQQGVNIAKTPLEMVQSVVSSIQVPQSQHNVTVSIQSPQISPQIVKHQSPTGLPPGHILVSSNGQLIMATAGGGGGGGGGQANVMAPPPPPKLSTSQNTAGMPPVSVSSIVTNVTATVSQVIPAVAQQVIGQQTVLVNTLPAPSFVLQPGVTMTMDGMTVATGQNVQIPQLVAAGNVIQQHHHHQQIHHQTTDHHSDPRRISSLLSPVEITGGGKKKGKKRKLPPQTVAGMLHIAAAQQNSGGMVMNHHQTTATAGFPQQIQMTHSQQGLTTTPVMQALTIVPSKNGGPPQIVMNGQTQHHQIITNSQPTQQYNLLQPVSLINGTTGVVQNIPAIQQFILPTNIGGSSMVMNADGTATILQDNLGMQLQIQNVNGQNVLTPIQNNNVFNSGQGILTAGPAGMVIRTPTSQGKIVQQHSPGAQFLSPNGGQFVVNGAQFNSQLSPLIASVSPSQQVTFTNTSPQQIRTTNQNPPQEYIQVNGQMGQTLMVPCTPQTSSSANQNTTFVQQNTTIVQQQTTMVANNQQLQNNHHQQQQQQQQQAQQNFMINADKNQLQALMVQQQQQQQRSIEDLNYRQSVSTQTAVNQNNSQSVTTNTFCQTSTLSAAGSPPDTTTLSPAASGGQSPPTADTTTHTGSTDDGLSPVPSNCSTSCNEISISGRPGSRTMAMVQCVSSSEPDLLESSNNSQSEQEWRKMNHQTSTSLKDEYMAMKHEYGDIGMIYNSKKQQNMAQLAYEDTAANMGIQFMDHKMKQNLLNAKSYGKIMHQKRNDLMVVMDSRHMSSLFDDENDEEGAANKEMQNAIANKHEFKAEDLVWGPTKGSSSWPGKIIQISKDHLFASVKWFGSERNISKIKIAALQTLSEGFDSHHQARKKARTSRKLSSQLEKAIQEAMAELDKQEAEKPPNSNEKVSSLSGKKTTSTRLRSGQR